MPPVGIEPTTFGLKVAHMQGKRLRYGSRQWRWLLPRCMESGSVELTGSSPEDERRDAKYPAPARRSEC